MNSRHAPALRVDVSPQRQLQALVAALAVLAAATASMACIAHFPWAWPSLLLLPLAAWLGWRSAGFAPCRLQWDGECWRYASALEQEATVPVQLQPVMDLGDWILLRVQQQKAGFWSIPIYLPLARDAIGTQWTALRAPLYSAKLREPSGP